MWEERKYSEKTAKAMDEEAKRIVDAAYERTVNLIKEKKEEVDKVAKLLLDKETVNGKDVFNGCVYVDPPNIWGVALFR